MGIVQRRTSVGCYDTIPACSIEEGPEMVLYISLVTMNNTAGVKKLFHMTRAIM